MSCLATTCPLTFLRNTGRACSYRAQDENTVLRLAFTMNPSCQHCEYFVIDPKELETLIPGLSIVSSAYGSVRADTAYCKFNDVFLISTLACQGFKPLSSS